MQGPPGPLGEKGTFCIAISYLFPVSVFQLHAIRVEKSATGREPNNSLLPSVMGTIMQLIFNSVCGANLELITSASGRVGGGNPAYFDAFLPV